MLADTPGNRRGRVVRSETLSAHGAVIIVDGDLDLATAPQLTAEISERIAHGHIHFIVDLTGATFLDSVAMTALLAAIEPLSSEQDAAVALVGATRIVDRSLQVSGVGDLFARFRERQDAVAALDASAPLSQGWRDARRAPR